MGLWDEGTVLWGTMGQHPSPVKPLHTTHHAPSFTDVLQPPHGGVIAIPSTGSSHPRENEDQASSDSSAAGELSTTAGASSTVSDSFSAAGASSVAAGASSTVSDSFSAAVVSPFSLSEA
jgi:hypothetical protein